jgi:hypothetical protein
MWNVIRTLAFAPHLPVMSKILRFAVKHAELIEGYGDHARKLADMSSSIQLINLPKIAGAAEFISSNRTSFIDPGVSEPLPVIREIQVLGHSDRAWKSGVFGARDTADEESVSQDRADDVWHLLHFALVRLSFPIDRWVTKGVIRVLVVGLGARQLLVSNKNVAPENRRVEILLFTSQSTTA